MSNLHYDATKDLIVGSTEMTEEQKKFLVLHEEMHRQFGRLPRPARVAQDVAINVDISGSMIPEDNSGSMAGVISNPNWADMLKKALAPVPYSAKQHQMIIITDGETQQSSFPKPKYEKFKSNEDMIEEKLLTGRGRRRNKEIAEVRREARKLNRKLKVQLDKRMRNAKLMQSVSVFKDTSGEISSSQMREFLQEVHSLKMAGKITED